MRGRAFAATSLVAISLALLAATCAAEDAKQAYYRQDGGDGPYYHDDHDGPHLWESIGKGCADIEFQLGQQLAQQQAQLADLQAQVADLEGRLNQVLPRTDLLNSTVATQLGDAVFLMLQAKAQLLGAVQSSITNATEAALATTVVTSVMDQLISDIESNNVAVLDLVAAYITDLENLLGARIMPAPGGANKPQGGTKQRSKPASGTAKTSDAAERRGADNNNSGGKAATAGGAAPAAR